MSRRFEGILKRVLAVVVMMTACVPVFSQTDAQFTQYYEVPSYYNPSALGLTDNVHIRAGMRMQWVGIKRAPQDFLILADSPLKIGKQRIGVGLVMENASEGLFSSMSLDAQFAYKIKLAKGKLQLGVGVDIGYRDQKFRGSKVVLPDNDDYHEGSDNAIPTTDQSGNALNLGVGLHLHHKYFNVGLACTHVNSPVIEFSAGDTPSGGGTGDGSGKNFEFKVGRSLYLVADGNIPVKNTLFEVMPSMLVKTDLQFWQGEVTARVRYNRFLTAGLGYRLNDAVSIVVGAEYKNFYIGYSYDYSLSAIAKASSGSHELFAGYNLKLDFSEKNKNRHKSIRIM